nr:hypothetical protein Iba_chr01dCG4690 [Ipomoea batatas]
MNEWSPLSNLIDHGPVLPLSATLKHFSPLLPDQLRDRTSAFPAVPDLQNKSIAPSIVCNGLSSVPITERKSGTGATSSRRIPELQPVINTTHPRSSLRATIMLIKDLRPRFFRVDRRASPELQARRICLARETDEYAPIRKHVDNMAPCGIPLNAHR